MRPPPHGSDRQVCDGRGLLPYSGRRRSLWFLGEPRQMSGVGSGLGSRDGAVSRVLYFVCTSTRQMHPPTQS